jgi:hypothetical protein
MGLYVLVKLSSLKRNENRIAVLELLRYRQMDVETRQDRHGEVNKHIFTTFRCEFKQSCPCTRHEGIQVEQRYSSPHSQPRRKMEVSGQYGDPATLLPGKNPGTYLIGGY